MPPSPFPPSTRWRSRSSTARRVTGLVAYVAPESHERLVDFLNRPEPFFRLLERDGVALVGRAHVARVALVPRH